MKKILAILCASILFVSSITVMGATTNNGDSDGDVCTNPWGGLFTTTASENKTTTKPVEKKTTTKSVSKIKRVVIKSASKKKTSKKAKISLKKISGCSGYIVKISTSKKFKKKKTITKKIKKTSYTFKNLKTKKKYYVKARAYKKVSKKIKYGAWSKVIKVKFKK